MIIFHKVRYMNFLSTGNQFTEVDLRRNRATLIVGKNGQGKCLVGSTEVKVRVLSIQDAALLGVELIVPFKTTLEKLTEQYNRTPEAFNTVEVLTRFGFKRIEAAAITARNVPSIKVVTESGHSVQGSYDHLMLSTNLAWTKLQNLKVGDYLFDKSGPTKIVKIKHYKTKQNLYDLQVEEVREFYANGLVSHNSTIIDSITFALYGKPYRNINKPQLINTITGKGLLVEIEFNVGKNEYLVRRGMKPNIFEIYQNGVILKQLAGARDDQDYLEKNILKLNFKSFSQVVVLGSANYVPFMQLPAAQRRTVVEDLLDIQVFTVMNSLLKEKASINKQDAKDTDYEIDICESKINLQRKHIEQLRANNDELIEQRQAKILEHQTAIDAHQEQAQQLITDVDKLSELTEDFDRLTDRKQKLLTLESNLEDRIRKLKKEVKFFHDHENCPTCKQGIDHEFRETTIQTRSSKIDEVKEALNKLESEIESTKSRLEEIQKINQQILDLNSKIQHNNQQIKFLNRYINDLNVEITNLRNNATKIAEQEHDESEYRKELQNLQTRKKRIADERAMYEVAAVLLKDSGIKTKIIRQFIPIMNKLINKYLAAMDFMCDFHLDENFNETIRSRYRDVFTYGSFSEGEKLRLNISIMLAWRAIAKIRNSAATNLLIMDEIFDGAGDANAVDAIIDILSNFEDDQNVFVISHSEKVADKFDHVITFEKHGNFSRIA